MKEDEIEDERLRELFQKAIRLTDEDVVALQKKLEKNPDDFDLRFTLFHHLRTKSFQEANCSSQLVDQVSWFISRKLLCDWVGLSIASAHSRFSSKQIDQLSSEWLAKILEDPKNDQLIGYAGYFIISTDPKKGELLLEKAATLNPQNSNWSFRLAMHRYLLFLDGKGKRKTELAKTCLELFLKDLGSAPWINLENAASCALFLNDLKQAEFCGKELILQIDEPYFEHMGYAILGIVALRRGKKSESVKLLLKRGTKKFAPNQFSFQLIQELFALGERDSLVKYIEGFERKVRKQYREKWIKQIKSDICPDFQYECC